MKWNAELAKEWIARQETIANCIFTATGNVRVYHGNQTALPRHYVGGERLCLRRRPITGSMRWMGHVSVYQQGSRSGIDRHASSRNVIPWLETSVAQESRAAAAAGGRCARPTGFTVVIDREGYSPDFFSQFVAKANCSAEPITSFPKERLATRGV